MQKKTNIITIRYVDKGLYLDYDDGLTEYVGELLSVKGNTFRFKNGLFLSVLNKMDKTIEDIILTNYNQKKIKMEAEAYREMAEMQKKIIALTAENEAIKEEQNAFFDALVLEIGKIQNSFWGFIIKKFLLLLLKMVKDAVEKNNNRPKI